MPVVTIPPNNPRAQPISGLGFDSPDASLLNSNTAHFEQAFSQRFDDAYDQYQAGLNVNQPLPNTPPLPLKPKPQRDTLFSYTLDVTLPS